MLPERLREISKNRSNMGFDWFITGPRVQMSLMSGKKDELMLELSYDCENWAQITTTTTSAEVTLLRRLGIAIDW